MTLSTKEVEHIAALARIGLGEEEVEKFARELSDVLEHFRELETVNTDGIEPIGHITGVTNVFRADRAEDCDEQTKKDIMSQVPQTKDGYIKVRSVL